MTSSTPTRARLHAASKSVSISRLEPRASPPETLRVRMRVAESLKMELERIGIGMEALRCAWPLNRRSKAIRTNVS